MEARVRPKAAICRAAWWRHWDQNRRVGWSLILPMPFPYGRIPFPKANRCPAEATLQRPKREPNPAKLWAGAPSPGTLKSERLLRGLVRVGLTARTGCARTFFSQRCRDLSRNTGGRSERCTPAGRRLNAALRGVCGCFGAAGTLGRLPRNNQPTQKRS